MNQVFVQPTASPEAGDIGPSEIRLASGIPAIGGEDPILDVSNFRLPQPATGQVYSGRVTVLYVQSRYGPSTTRVGFVTDEGTPNMISVVVSAPNRKTTGTFCVVFLATTMFLSAFLLFSIEPMVAKMILPLLGGAAAVWNTCLVFFQAVL